MPNPFSKGWNYLKASLDQKVDDNADPKILVRQAMDNARQQHKSVADQAAAVIGNAKQLEITMGTKARQLDEVQGQVRQTLQVAESARAEGDAARAAQFDTQAEQLAGRLVTLEQDLEHTRQLHGQAVQAAEQAKHAVKESEHRLREILAQEDQLLLQATQAEMQHRSSESLSLEGVGGGNSPTFDEIRAKIEGRYTTALGKQELAEATGAASSAQLDAAAFTRESQGRSKLEQIRASMGLTGGAGAAVEGAGSGSGSSPQLTEGAGEPGQADAGGHTPGTSDSSGPSDPAGSDPSGPTFPRDTRE
ncbi:PspA/IM30 family protein [Rhodococcus sp. IEGM 1408]|uniref:PspA/IM30 family protein n=1 Tax=Rhodococcus sp. IEGM 1408 TaxID=3082220 RepID=UPI0029540705|nr:PspA/IM30 family protein [Rhodococcus sp. IEGM 1408]MDV7999652.1 PspA/IM30 family protein [Rhodococcus sp. IEGM 1408]